MQDAALPGGMKIDQSRLQASKKRKGTILAGFVA